MLLELYVQGVIGLVFSILTIIYVVLFINFTINYIVLENELKHLSISNKYVTNSLYNKRSMLIPSKDSFLSNSTKCI